MVEAFRKGDITDVDLLPTYNQIKNSLKESASLRQIKSVDMEVHHIVPESVMEELRDVFGALPSNHSTGDVAAVALSKADHLAISKVMNPWLRSRAYKDLGTAAEKARAIVNWYGNNNQASQAAVALAWFKKRGIL